MTLPTIPLTFKGEGPWTSKTGPFLDFWVSLPPLNVSKGEKDFSPSFSSGGEEGETAVRPSHFRSRYHRLPDTTVFVLGLLANSKTTGVIKN